MLKAASFICWCLSVFGCDKSAPVTVPQSGCASLVQRGAEVWKALEPQAGVSAQDLTARSLGDLNDDGRSDFGLVATYKGCGVTGNCTTTVYVTEEGTCPRYAGVIHARADELFLRGEPGQRELRARLLDRTHTDGCREYTIVDYSHDGGTFRADSELHCTCDAMRSPECESR